MVFGENKAITWILWVYLFSFAATACNVKLPYSQSSESQDAIVDPGSSPINLKPVTLCQWEEGVVVRILESDELKSLFWEACYDFSPCEPTEDGSYIAAASDHTEQKIQDYRTENCTQKEDTPSSPSPLPRRI